MKTGLGLVIASSILIATGACAGGGGSTGGGGGGPVSPTPPPTEGPETVDPGETPRETELTGTADAQIEQAQIALEEGDEQAARTHYGQAADAAEQAIAADATNPLPWLQAGIAYIGLDEYARADSALSEAEDLRPLYEFDIAALREEAWIALYDDAAPLVNQGDYEAAAEVFEQAHTIYKDRPEVMLTLGQIWAQQGRFDEAVDILQEARELIQSDEAREPHDSTTIAGWEEQAEAVRPVIAQSLINAGRLDEGAEFLRELVAENPEDLNLRRQLANLYVTMEQPDSARAIYTELLERGTLSSSELYEIGIGFYQLDDFERAADSFEQAVQQSPRDRDSAEFWARTLTARHPVGGEGADTVPPAALEELKEAATTWLELDPYSQDAHVVLAQTENRLGNQERASELVMQVEELPVVMQSLQIRPMPGGGATLIGTIQNRTAEAGAQATIEVTFYGQGDAAVGTQSATVSLPAPDATQTFEIAFDSDQAVAGYTYTVGGV